jgi:hypothetical protein
MRHRGVILRFARESDLKKQEACQFADARPNTTNLSQASAGNAGIKGVSLTDLADASGTGDASRVFSAQQ